MYLVSQVVRDNNMNISAINTNESNARNLFIKYANQFMNFKANSEEETPVSKPEIESVKKLGKTMGIETLTIFPKQVIDGKTVTTA